MTSDMKFYALEAVVAATIGTLYRLADWAFQKRDAALDREDERSELAALQNILTAIRVHLATEAYIMLSQEMQYPIRVTPVQTTSLEPLQKSDFTAPTDFCIVRPLLLQSSITRWR